MSNPLSVRRVKVQTIDENGNPEGEPTYGVMAADSHEQAYNDTFATLEELNAEIEKEGCILHVIDNHDYLFGESDPEKIGKANFYGKDWQPDDDEDELDNKDDDAIEDDDEDD